MKIKPWQMAVIVLGLLIGVGSLVYTLTTSQTPDISHIIHCVDVESGTIYEIDVRTNPQILPARNPDTGRVALLRVLKDDATGQWAVSGRDLSTLRFLDKGVKNTAVDPDTGQLVTPPKDPVKYVRKY